MLAVAETALTRVSKAKAQALAETAGKRGEILLSLVERQDWLNPVLLVVLSTQLVQSTLLGVFASRLLGGWGVVGATVLNVTLFFVVAEVAPKTWAIQHTDQAALAAARPVRMLARCPRSGSSHAGSSASPTRCCPARGSSAVRTRRRRSSSPSRTSPSRRTSSRPRSASSSSR